jgi:hypothetical protein
MKKKSVKARKVSKKARALRSAKECVRHASKREMNRKRNAGLESRIQKIVREAKKNGTYYGPEIVTAGGAC